MQSSEVRNVQTSTVEKPNSSYTDEPTRVKIQRFIYISRTKNTPSKIVMYTFWTGKTDGLRGGKEAIYMKHEKPTLNRGSGQRLQPP